MNLVTMELVHCMSNAGSLPVFEMRDTDRGHAVGSWQNQKPWSETSAKREARYHQELRTHGRIGRSS